MLAELQQPTDFSILLEHEGFAGGVEGWHLGLGPERALEAVDLSVWTYADLKIARSSRFADDQGVQPLFPGQADQFFRADRIRPAPTRLEQGFSVLLVVDGQATLSGNGWETALVQGTAVLVPFAVGECELSGSAEVLRCRAANPIAGGA